MQTVNSALSTYEKRNFPYAKSIFLKKTRRAARRRIHFCTTTKACKNTGSDVAAAVKLDTYHPFRLFTSDFLLI